MPYIDREKLLNEIKINRSLIVESKAWNSGIDCAVGHIKRAKTADVVPVVRCKDCKYGAYDFTANYYWCKGKGYAYEAEFYCADGERRDDAETVH